MVRGSVFIPFSRLSGTLCFQLLKFQGFEAFREFWRTCGGCFQGLGSWSSRCQAALASECWRPSLRPETLRALCAVMSRGESRTESLQQPKQNPKPGARMPESNPASFLGVSGEIRAGHAGGAVSEAVLRLWRNPSNTPQNMAQKRGLSGAFFERRLSRAFCMNEGIAQAPGYLPMISLLLVRV